VKELLEELERWGADVIFGRARGFRAALARILMFGLSGFFRLAVALRLKLFRDAWKPQAHLGVRVISIGNLTVGGTGKTPVVELFARTLRDRGRRVAILSRGYKSRKLEEPQVWLGADGLAVVPEEMPRVVSDGERLLLPVRNAGDEPFMLAKNLTGVSVVVDKDRVKGGRFAVRELQADFLLLDDGLQYLKLAHGTDIVLIDSNSPFGTGALLPRGTLREPAKNLCRASYIFITKCDGSPQDALVAKLRRYNQVADIIECTHGPKHLENVFTGERQPLEFLRDKWVAAISGIAVPESFENKLTELGARVEIRRRFSDHHTFSKRDINQFMRRCVERDMELILTTEKDAVRFPRPAELDVPVFFLRIEVEILKGHELWEKLIDRLCLPHDPGQTLLLTRAAHAV
jgi:tetraacyldisaccharide 4'-kinase